MKFLTAVLISLSLIFATSCQRQVFTLSPNGSNEVPANPDYKDWDHMFLFGMFPTGKHDAAKMCENKGGVELVSTKLQFWQGVLAGITYGIYTPRIFIVQCKGK